MSRPAFIVVMAFALLACTDRPTLGGPQNIDRAAGAPQADPAGNEYSEAVALVRSGHPVGYKKLLAVARARHSAEWSEVAQDRLLLMMYEDPAGWLRGMAPLDGPDLRAYLGKNGLYPNDLPPGIAEDREFERRCIERLRTAGANESERLLASFIVRFYEDDLAKSK